MNKRVKEKLVLKKSIKKAISKFMLTIIIFLLGMISVKANPSLKKHLKKNIYEKNIKFTKTKSFYEKHFGSILSLDKVIKEEQPVFNEKLTYEKKEPYQNGVKLIVQKNYLVPTLESGIVVFIGEKENLGSTVIIEQVDGIDTFYSNINIIIILNCIILY